MTTDEPPAPPVTSVGESVPRSITINPQRLLRIAAVTREVLNEARRVRPQGGAVDHLRRLHSQICSELHEALPPELYEELSELTPEIREDSVQELVLAHAEILGWLEGLLQAIQVALAQVTVRAREAPPPRPELDRPEPEDGDPGYL